MELELRYAERSLNNIQVSQETYSEHWRCASSMMQIAYGNTMQNPILLQLPGSYSAATSVISTSDWLACTVPPMSRGSFSTRRLESL